MQVQKVALIVLIISSCVVSYSNTLFSNFLWDDTALITKNPYIRSFKFLPNFFTQDIWNIGPQTMISGYYRPLLAASFTLDYLIWHTNPFGYHLTNLIFHSLASILVFVLAQMLFKETVISFFSALLFSVHPIHTEAVSFISGRVDVICLVFFLSSLVLFLHYLSNKKFIFYLFSLICFFVSLLVKEMAITLPFVVLAVDYLILSRQDIKKVFKNLLGLHLGFFAVAALYLLMRTLFVGWSFFKLKPFHASNFTSGTTALWHLFTAIKILTYYLRLLIFPYGLKADYVFAAANFLFEPAVVLGIIVLLSLLFIAIINRKNNPMFSFSIAWFFITVLPVSNLIPSGNIFAERFMYMPSVGFAIAIGFLFSRLRKMNPRLLFLNWRHSVSLIFFLIIIWFGRVSFERNKVWKNDFTLWYETIKATPGSARSHLNLANVYYQANLLDKAIEENSIALKLHPQSYYVFNNVGNIYLKKGLIDEAIKAYKIAIGISPDKALAYSNLATAYGKKGMYRASIEASLTALKNNPYQDDARYNLALSYANAGFTDKAIEAYEEYLKVQPDFPGVHLNVGYLYYKKGNFPKAKEHWLEALRLSPNLPEAKEALKLLKGVEIPAR